MFSVFAVALRSGEHLTFDTITPTDLFSSEDNARADRISTPAIELLDKSIPRSALSMLPVDPFWDGGLSLGTSVSEQLALEMLFSRSGKSKPAKRRAHSLPTWNTVHPRSTPAASKGKPPRSLSLPSETLTAAVSVPQEANQNDESLILSGDIAPRLVTGESLVPLTSRPTPISSGANSTQ